jgi:membrane protease YdiL (CAAX protease family)
MTFFADREAVSSLANRYALVLFFVLAYLFSWSIWGLEGRFADGGLLVWLGSAGPAVAAVVVAALSQGRRGLEALLSRLLKWRVGIKWYLVALLLVPMAGLGIGAVYVLTGNVTAALPGIDYWRANLGMHFVAVTSAVAFGSLVSVGEELGWRGYALPKLQERLNPLASSVLIGLLWGGWHFNGLLGGQAEALQFLDILFFVLGTVSASVIYTWIFNNARGSVPIACLFHSVYDVTVIWVLAVLPLPPSATRVGMLGLAAVALVIILLAGPRLSYQPQPATKSASPRQGMAESAGQ